MNQIKVVDETGQVFESLRSCLMHHGISVSYTNGKTAARLRRNGFITVHGHKFTLVHDEPKGDAAAPVDPLYAKLKQRYTTKELEQIARGEGIQKSYIPYPEIHLTGRHHRMVVMSDTHIGSIYSPPEWHDVVADFVNDPANRIECVLHCGDIVEGLKIGRAGTQIYELSELGFDAQRQRAVELMSKYSKPIYIISGNHDMYFKEYAGANIVQSICDAVPNMTYIGHDSADIKVDGCIIRLFHGQDGSAYSLGYRLQKLVESYTGGQKPNILLAGHVHKYVHIFERNIQAVSVPCMQMQTSFMRGRKLAAHTGFLVIDFEVNDGNISSFSVQLFPFYG